VTASERLERATAPAHYFRGVVEFGRQMNRASFTIVAAFFAIFAGNAFAQLDAHPNLVCPRFQLFASTLQAVDGDVVTFNISLAEGNVDLNAVKYAWRIYPRGRIDQAHDTPVATLDTSTVKGSWAIVSIEVEPFQMCPQYTSRQIAIRRKGPYTKADDFWWWFQLHEEDFRAYKMADYPRWLDELTERMHAVDERLTFKISHDWKDPMKRGFIVGYRGKPYDAKLVNDFLARAPDLAGFDFVSAKAQR